MCPDCHGLPVEFEIDKKLGISGRDDVLKMGIKAYNAECRAIVMRYSKEWETTVKRVGRWIDFDNDYKTMNLSFMETVWWVFGQLHKKNLVYRGFKVMPYSCACNTPLSNFEVQQNYKVCVTRLPPLQLTRRAAPLTTTRSTMHTRHHWDDDS